MKIINNIADLRKISEKIKKNKKKIVLCHGVFDILHIGHVLHFEQAKKMGDVLIVSITGDKFVNKGKNRPIFDEDKRLKLLASLEIIDYVFISNNRSAINSINKIKPDFILSPDKGAIERASFVAETIGCKFSYLEKTRIDAHTIVHKAKDLDVNDAIVTIVDDMISTGGTICRASEALRDQGAKAVFAACSHGLFTGGAISKLDNFVDGVIASDSLKNPRSVVSSASALCRGIAKLMEN